MEAQNIHAAFMQKAKEKREREEAAAAAKKLELEAATESSVAGNQKLIDESVVPDIVNHNRLSLAKGNNLAAKSTASCCVIC